MKPPIYRFHELDAFRTSIEASLTNLEVQGLDISAGSPFIAPVIFRKLPFKVKDTVQVRSNNNYPTMQEILDALDQIIANLSSHVEVPNETSTGAKQHKKFVPNNIKSQMNPERKDVSNFNLAVSKGKTLHEDKCVFCGEKHKPRNCAQYKDVESRTARLLELNRCTRCVKRGHDTKDCRSTIKQCYICKGSVPHHSFMCTSDNIEDVKVVVSSVDSSTATRMAMPTATLQLYTQSGLKDVRCMFDQCAQKSFILSQTVRNLDLKLVGKANLGISGFLSKKSAKVYDVAELSIKILDKDIKIEVVVADELPESIKTKNLAVAINELKRLNVKLADPEINSDCINDIKILIGLDNYFKFFAPNEIVKDVKLLNSTVGKVVVGEIPSEFTQINTPACTSVQVNRLAVCIQEEENLEPPIHKLWDLESVGLGYDQTDPDDDLAMNTFLKSIKYTDNRYSVNLPWKVNNKYLPSNYGSA